MFRKTRRGLLVMAMVLTAAIFAAGNIGVVKKVLSGDIVQIGDTFVARLTGIKAPPKSDPLGSMIYDFTKRELEGQMVKLSTWTTDNTAAGIVHDSQGYPFVQIYYGKGTAVCFNEVMLKKGYARVDPEYLPDELEHYRDLEKEAREKGLGIWKSGGTGPFGCTIVMAARDGLVLAGNNEDRNHPKTIVNFIPASGSFYGRVVFGYDDAFVQGGMNDQGLFVDGNALAPTGWKPDPDKPTFRGIVMMVILATCATCEDVKAFFGKSNFPALNRARFPVADRTGASMVVEYGQGSVQFVRSDTWYQIATNFVMSNVKDGNYPCWRYQTADKIMSGAKRLTVDLIRDVLEKTHQEGNSLTVYSNIYDLKNGLIYVYNLRNFEQAVVMDLAEELKKGQRRLDLPSLFKPRAKS